MARKTPFTSAPSRAPAPAKTTGVAAAPSPTLTAAPAGNPRITVTLTHDQIAKRAYEIWVAKGRPQGKDLENWQQAERELRGALVGR